MDQTFIRACLQRALQASLRGSLIIGSVQLGGCVSSSGGPPYECGPVTVGEAPPLEDGGLDCGTLCAAAGYSETPLSCVYTPASARNLSGVTCSFETDACPPTTGSGCSTECGLGRRPGWLLPAHSSSGASPVGNFFADMHRLEAAAVFAFRHMASELRLHRAPRSLVRWAERSADEEVRHARTAAYWARHFGAAPIPATVGDAPEQRTLAAMALENAVEGCAKETYGALVASWQGQHATHRGIRRSLRRIGLEETRHAELGWAVARWAEPRLTRAERQRVREARSETLAALATERRADGSPELAMAGIPDARMAQVLARNLQREVAG